MGKPLPVETRRAIVRMIEQADCSQEEIAKIFKIGYRSVQRYWSTFCQTGDVDSHAKFGGHKKRLLAPYEQEVTALITKKPDITLEELREQLAKKNIRIGQTALFDFLKALGYSNKKNSIWSRAETEGCGRTKRSVQKAATRT
jgi:putative transposase